MMPLLVSVNKKFVNQQLWKYQNVFACMGSFEYCEGWEALHGLYFCLSWLWLRLICAVGSDVSVPGAPHVSGGLSDRLSGSDGQWLEGSGHWGSGGTRFPDRQESEAPATARLCPDFLKMFPDIFLSFCLSHQAFIRVRDLRFLELISSIEVRCVALFISFSFHYWLILILEVVFCSIMIQIFKQKF